MTTEEPQSHRQLQDTRPEILGPSPTTVRRPKTLPSSLSFRIPVPFLVVAPGYDAGCEVEGLAENFSADLRFIVPDLDNLSTTGREFFTTAHAMFRARSQQLARSGVEEVRP